MRPEELKKIEKAYYHLVNGDVQWAQDELLRLIQNPEVTYGTEVCRDRYLMDVTTSLDYHAGEAENGYNDNMVYTIMRKDDRWVAHTQIPFEYEEREE